MSEQCKASERERLRSLQPQIEIALAARRAREVLAAPAAAKQQLDAALQRAHELRAQVSIAAAKERAKRLPTKGAPPLVALGPTPERVAKEDKDAVTTVATPIRDDGTRMGMRTHAVQPPYERYQDSLPQDLLAAAVQAVSDILTAEAGPKVTASYDGVPVTSFGARHGGVQDYVREKAALVDEMRATLDRDFLKVIDWVITRTVIKSSGEAMSLADVGREVSPWEPGKKGEKDTAVGFGRMYQTLVRLREFYALQGALGKQTTPPSPAEVRRLLTAGAARLQRRREQYARHLENESKKRTGGR